MVMIKILGLDFKVYDNSKYRSYNDLGVYVLCDSNFNAVYVGMSIYSITNRVVSHKSKGWSFKYVLIHTDNTLGFKDYLKINNQLDWIVDILIETTTLCRFFKQIESNVYKKHYLNIEKNLIKALEPKYNIIHNKKFIENE